MAEAAVGGALVLVELVLPFLNRTLLRDDMSTNVDRMRSWLKSAKAFLEDHGHGDGSRTLENKVEQVRDIAYEIEDVLDEIVLHSRHIFHSHKFTQNAHQVAHNIWHGFPYRGISQKMESIMAKIKTIKLQAEAFSEGNSRSASSLCITDVHRQPLLLPDVEMVGYTCSKEKITSQLMDGEGNLAILAVVGPGGSGKTVFVRNVFCRPTIRDQFDAHAWVCVSKNFDVKKVFIDILNQFCDGRKESYHALEDCQASKKLREHLQAKRYIIVLDDIWKHEHWDCIKAALPDGLPGSKVIVTTRVSTLASFCASSPTLKHKLNRGLEEFEAWFLFCKIAFKEENGECPCDLKNYAKKIVERCEGMPGAIGAIANALTELRKLPREWERFNIGLGSEIGADDPHLSIINHTLQSSYMDLSSNLKSCFLFFSIFPEHYSIERGRLIRLWVAERFVMESGGKTVEEVAEEYLEELIHRNLVRVSDWDFDARPRKCRVLNLVHTFITQKSRDYNFASIYPRENSNTNQRMRHISVYADCSDLSQNIDLRVARTMLLFRRKNDSASHMDNHVHAFSLLKVLDLQNAPLNGFPEQITSLILLIYLSLRQTEIKNVPKSIKKLHHLETFDLRQTAVRELPKKISHLGNIRHLFAYKYKKKNSLSFDSVLGVRLFEGIRNLTNLQNLSLVEVGQSGSIIKELKHTTQLRKLGLVGLREEHSTELCKSLGHLKHLSTLDLHASSENEFLDVGDLHDVSPSIQKLYLKGRLKKFPGWISSLDNLLRIGLKWTKLAERRPLENLKHLPNLMEIQLVDSFEGEVLEFEASTFKKLKILLIQSFSALNRVVIEEGAMPELKIISFCKCLKLLFPPSGLENLAQIKKLEAHDMPPEFSARLKKYGEDSNLIERISDDLDLSLSEKSWSLENVSGFFSI